MPTITANGVKLAYDERGSSSPALVFIHGWTCNRSFFAPQVEHFAKRHRVVAVERRGETMHRRHGHVVHVGLALPDPVFELLKILRHGSPVTSHESRITPSRHQRAAASVFASRALIAS